MRYSAFVSVLFSFLLTNKSLAQQGVLMLPTGHTNTVKSGIFSPNDRFVLTNSSDNTLKLWESRTGKIIRDVAAGLAFTSVEFSPSGEYILAASTDGKARVWETQTGRLMYRLNRHIAGISNAHYNCNGTLIITSSTDYTFKIWDAQSGNFLKSVTEGNFPIPDARFSPDGKFIVTISGDNKTRLYQTGPAGKSKVIGEHSSHIKFMEISNDSKYILTGGEDSTVNIYALPTGDLCYQVKSTRNNPAEAHFGHQSKYVAIVTGQSTVDIYNLPKKQLLTSITDKRTIMLHVMFCPGDSSIVTAGTDYSSLWNIYTGNQVHRYPLRKGLLIPLVTSLAISNDQKSLLTNATDNSSIIWDLNHGTVSEYLEGQSKEIRAICFSEDGRLLASGGYDSTVKIWGAKTGLLQGLLKGHTGFVLSLCFTPDATKIASGAVDSTVKIWDVQHLTLLKNIKCRSFITILKYSPSGKFLAVATADSMINIIETTHYSIQSAFNTGSKHISDFNFDTTETKLVVCTGECKLYEFSPGLIKFLYTIPEPNVSSATFTPDGYHILTGGNRIAFHSTKNRKIEFIIPLFTPDYNSTRLSPDGSRILTAGAGVIKAFSTISQQVLYTLEGHSSSINNITFSKDGSTIASTAKDNIIKIWDTNKEELLFTIMPLNNYDYLVVDKYGRFDGTANAMRQIYYVCEQELIDLEQVRNMYWEPGLVSKLSGLDTIPITTKGVHELNVCGYAPIIEDKSFYDSSYHFLVTERYGGVSSISLYINGSMVKSFNKETLYKYANKYHIDIPKDSVKNHFLKYEDNILSINALTADKKMYSNTASITSYVSSPNKPHSSNRLFCLSIGISKYKGDSLKLSYASKDSKDFLKVIAAACRNFLDTGNTSHVTTYSLNTDTKNEQEWPTKDNITRVLQEISKTASADDMLILFMAGHGILYDNNNFYFLTAEASNFNIAGIENDVSISFDELGALIHNVYAKKKILVLDACNSGQFVNSLLKYRGNPENQNKALQQFQTATGFNIIAASATGKNAFESSLYNNGLLTYSLLATIQSGQVLQPGNFIDLSLWLQYSAKKTSELAILMGKEQNPVILNNTTFPFGKVDSNTLRLIQLSNQKAIFTSTDIQPENMSENDIGIASLVNDSLAYLSASEISPIVFIPGLHSENALHIYGRYRVDRRGRVYFEGYIKKGGKSTNTKLNYNRKFKNKHEFIGALMLTIINNFHQ